MKKSYRSFYFAALLICGLAGASHAATLSISPASISNSYSGNLTLQISGLTNGETVLIERFLDLNTNGIIDATEPLVQSFKLTDGQVTSIGGVRNGNIPGDNDLAANSQITSSLNFGNGAEFTRGSGTQIFRLSSPTGRFSPAQQSLTVTQASDPQQITGTVSSGGSPLAFAIVGALVQIGNDNQFVYGTVADSSGNFSLNVSNGTYQLIGFKSGYIGSFATSPQVAVAGATTNVTLPLTVAGLTVSGNVIEAGTGLGIAGFQFFITSTNNEYSVFFSDASGAFSLSLVTGQWKIDSSDASLTLGGYLRPQNKVNVNVSGSNVGGVIEQFTKGTALIYGTVKTQLDAPLAGVRLTCNDDANTFDTSAVTDSNGNYFLAVSNATWYVSADNNASGLPNGYTLQQAQIPIANGQAIQTNLIANLATAHLLGHASDSGGNPITGGSMLGFGPSGQNVNAQIGGDGSFDVPVSAGSWTLSLESETASSRNLVASQISFNVTDGVNVSNINYVAQISTRTISGSVKTGNNTGISGLNVSAGSSINGTNYFSNAMTDSGGNYSMLSLQGVWSVGLDQQGLTQRGYGSVTNQSADTSSANQVVNFVLNKIPPTISGAARLTGQRFQFLINGPGGQNFTVQFSTNLSHTNWSTLQITNGATPITVLDPAATNPARFYRVLLGP